MSDIKEGEKSDFEAKCPQCGELMADMGLDFESPKKDDLKKWEHIKSLYSVGITFHSCGCGGPGYIPNSKEKLIEYFEKMKKTYLKEMDFWRSKIGPEGQKEIAINQERLDYWHESVKEVDEKLNQIK
ncbi:hypothetical protein [Flavobacterium sp. B183]|uniref:hypothetical protein n=1 Tax=Flavobacterium sp. B183 TaxID=907046 RepID=UPI00201F52C1|nr:hypothetical protein [Flavobacterium sp. B183]URC13483.1 hypothetical protein M4I44_03560 [Flavobacterium sp. B183]